MPEGFHPFYQQYDENLCKNKSLSADNRFSAVFNLVNYIMEGLHLHLCLTLNFKIMFELFYRGGPLFMGILSFLLLLIIIVSVINTLRITSNKFPPERIRMKLSYVKSIGLFAMITGILGQLIGLYSAFDAIEAAGDVSPAMIFGGLKVSMITTLYGVFIYLFSLFIWFILSNIFERKI